MTTISYTIDKTCKKHPLCPPKRPPGTISVSERRLFGYGSLWLQDPKIGRRTYEDTKPLWDTLHRQYNDYLTYGKTELRTKASGEPLTRLSEVVGIGCGLAALVRAFPVKLNRLTRYLGGGKGRRLDFEWAAAGARYFHECKGTTYPDRFDPVYQQIVQQKSDTKARCALQNYGPPLTAATGSIVLYQHDKRTSYGTQILLVDPPVQGDSAQPEPESRELARVLRHYLGYFEVTHQRPHNSGLIGLADWLPGVIETLERNGRPPSTPPKGLHPTGRVRDPLEPPLPYSGTIFDSRTTSWAVANFANFAEASAHLNEPVTFVGVRDDLTALIARCNWDDVLSFHDANAALEDDGERVILESGVMTAKLSPGEYEASARQIFKLLKRQR